MDSKEFQNIIKHKTFEISSIRDIVVSMKKTVNMFPVKIVLTIKCLFKRPSDGLTLENIIITK